MRWTGTFLVTNKSNKIGFTDNEVNVSLKAEMVSACLHDPNKYMVKSMGFSGPYVVKSSQEIADYFLAQGEVTLLNSEDMVDFEVVACNPAGRSTEPITEERAREVLNSKNLHS